MCNVPEQLPGVVKLLAESPPPKWQASYVSKLPFLSFERSSKSIRYNCHGLSLNFGGEPQKLWFSLDMFPLNASKRGQRPSVWKATTPTSATQLPWRWASPARAQPCWRQGTWWGSGGPLFPLDCYWVGSLDFDFLGNQGVFH